MANLLAAVFLLDSVGPHEDLVKLQDGFGNGKEQPDPEGDDCLSPYELVFVGIGKKLRPVNVLDVQVSTCKMRQMNGELVEYGTNDPVEIVLLNALKGRFGRPYLMGKIHIYDVSAA